MIQQKKLLTEDAPHDAVKNFAKLIHLGDHICKCAQHERKVMAC